MPGTSDPPGFQTVISWRGEEVRTLADIPPVEGGILLIGINPSPVSVEAGHYYQGTLGQRLWSRLQEVSALPTEGSRWEDERWQEAGNGVTDVVKRPTASERDLLVGDLAEGGLRLRDKLSNWKPGLILFPFVAPAEAVLQATPPPGVGPDFEGVPTFRLAGPYARTADVKQNITELSGLLAGSSTRRASEGAQRVVDRVVAPSPSPGEGAVSQPVTAADKAAGRIRFPRSAKHFFPSTRASLTVVLRGQRVDGRYDPRTGPDRERSAVLSLGRQAVVGIAESTRLRVSRRPTDGLVSLD
jgi:TDG/mug DNA glycosylase family protein